MAPQKVDKLITLKVAKLITLWRPNLGQKVDKLITLQHIYIWMGDKDTHTHKKLDKEIDRVSN